MSAFFPLKFFCLAHPCACFGFQYCVLLYGCDVWQAWYWLHPTFPHHHTHFQWQMESFARAFILPKIFVFHPIHQLTLACMSQRQIIDEHVGQSSEQRKNAIPPWHIWYRTAMGTTCAIPWNISAMTKLNGNTPLWEEEPSRIITWWSLHDPNSKWPTVVIAVSVFWIPQIFWSHPTSGSAWTFSAFYANIMLIL